MVGKILQPEQGLTFDVFREDEEEGKPIEEEDPEFDEDGNRIRDPKPVEIIEVLPKYLYVKEVVLEPRMHFFKVPRLGSYLAIKMEYNSCMQENALDLGVADYMSFK